MKQLDKKDPPKVSGGEYAPGPYESGELLPPWGPTPTYPQFPGIDQSPVSKV